jgi:uncharacterized membrane protein YfhO
VTDLDGYAKKVVLSGVEEGSRVTIRSNYFPAWKASYKGKDIPISSANGQLAFTAPASGNLTVDLKFPKYTALTIIAILALVLCWFL